MRKPRGDHQGGEQEEGTGEANVKGGPRGGQEGETWLQCTRIIDYWTQGNATKPISNLASKPVIQQKTSKSASQQS